MVVDMKLIFCLLIIIMRVLTNNSLIIFFPIIGETPIKINMKIYYDTREGLLVRIKLTSVVMVS